MVHASDAGVLPGRAAAPLAHERRFARFAAFVLAYTLCVIVYGAWVRITGSGAGCGDHWPSCHGELVLRGPTQQTLIEYTHRVTSGALGLMALALPLLALRSFPRGHAARRYSWATFGLVCVEAAIGAGLVLGRLVASDASVARAVAVALHLGNTLLLTACATLTVAAARNPSQSRASTRMPSPGAKGGALGPTLLAALLAALVLVAMSGAVTALGDTLFPVSAGTGPALPPADHFLVQLRVLHPVLACFGVCLALFVARYFLAHATARPWARAVALLAGVQLGLGGVNIALSAPGWLQLAHLLLAQLLWISAVLLAYSSRIDSMESMR